jgi:hypothetical protein
VDYIQVLLEYVEQCCGLQGELSQAPADSSVDSLGTGAIWEREQWNC